MAGAIILAVVLVVVFPVAFCMTGAVAAGILGWAAKDDAEQRHAGSELVELNR
ncbi:MAG: hypothetical protein HYX34_15475 [Actinobacteria bacterium]|nr:hypothetical protein [Actinomycetota bacterium]